MARFLSIRNYHLLVCLVFFLLTLISLRDPMLSYGDSHSDADVLISGENFAKFGFADSYGAPVFDRRDSYSNCKSHGENCAYTHYPPLTNWINGVWQTLGITSLIFFRFLALVFSCLAALILPWALGPLFFNEILVVSVASLVILNPIFLDHADSLHQFPLNYLCLFAFIGFWMRYLQSLTQGYLLGAALSFFVSTWTSFEYFSYISGFAFLSLISHRKFRSRWKTWGGLIALALIPCLTMLIRVYQQSFLFSSYEDSIRSFTSAVETRTALSWGEFLYKAQGRILDFLLPALPWIFLTLFALRKQKKSRGPSEDEVRSQRIQDLWRWTAIFFVSGFSWWVLMRQHAVVHAHTSHQFLIFYAMIFVASVVTQWQNYEKAPLSKRRGFFIVSLFFILIGVSVNLSRSKTLSRFIALNPKEHAVVQRQEHSLKELEKWSKTLEANTHVLLDPRAHALAYHFQREFLYFNESLVCTDPTDRTLVIFEDNQSPAFERCQKNFKSARQLGRFYLFSD